MTLIAFGEYVLFCMYINIYIVVLMILSCVSQNQTYLCPVSSRDPWLVATLDLVSQHFGSIAQSWRNGKTTRACTTSLSQCQVLLSELRMFGFRDLQFNLKSLGEV